MIRQLLVVFVCSGWFFSAYTQNLLPHIGVSSQPEMDDTICEPPVYDGSFHDVGLFVGDVAPDFTLYTTHGEERQLSQILASGKHVMIVNGSYTCWRFRDVIPTINDITELFEDQMETFVVYTVEAHPHIDLSPYSGTLSTGDRNFQDSVLLRQPTTYQERLQNIQFMIERDPVVPEILADGTCNEWWLNYGTAANHAYLIDPDGVVQIRHTWFNQPPQDIQCELTEYFELPSPGCAEIGTFGSFEIEVDEEQGTYQEGIAGQTLMVPVTIRNLSETDFVFVDIVRDSVTTPQAWLTALCVDICLSPGVNETTTAITPGESQSFTFYFFTNHEPGEGSAVVRFKNVTNALNTEWVTFSVSTQSDETITSLESVNEPQIRLYPNPAVNWLRVAGLGNDNTPWQIFDSASRLADEGYFHTGENNVSVADLQKGVYVLRIGAHPAQVLRFIKH